MRPRGRNAGVHVFAVLEAGDQEAEELAGDGPVDAVPDGALRGGFGGSAEGWLTPLRFLSSLPRVIHGGWRGTPPLRTRKDPRSGGVRGRARRPPSPVAAHPDG